MTKNNSTTTKKRVRRDRTEEILEAATKLLAKYGFQGSTLARVAEDVGLTEPGVLHYFPSKVDLLQGVLEYHERKEVETYSALIAEPLIQLFTVLVSESIRSDHPSHDYFVDRYRQGREMYIFEFLKLHDANIRPDVDINELVILIMAVMDGLQIQWLLDPEKVDMGQTFKLFSKIVIDYLTE